MSTTNDIFSTLANLSTDIYDLLTRHRKARAHRAALLMACQAMLNSTDYCDDERPLMNAIRAAVAKAEAE